MKVHCLSITFWIASVPVETTGMQRAQMEREGVEKAGGCRSNVRRSRIGARAEKQKKLRKAGARRGRRKFKSPHAKLAYGAPAKRRNTIWCVLLHFASE